MSLQRDLRGQRQDLLGVWMPAGPHHAGISGRLHFRSDDRFVTGPDGVATEEAASGSGTWRLSCPFRVRLRPDGGPDLSFEFFVYGATLTVILDDGVVVQYRRLA
jgi:hypothetical protein